MLASICEAPGYLLGIHALYQSFSLGQADRQPDRADSAASSARPSTPPTPPCNYCVPTGAPATDRPHGYLPAPALPPAPAPAPVCRVPGSARSQRSGWMLSAEPSALTISAAYYVLYLYVRSGVLKPRVNYAGRRAAGGPGAAEPILWLGL